MNPSPRDWPQDAIDDPDNGAYLCRCCYCHATFTGHKRRASCRVCSDRNAAEFKQRTEWLRTHDAPKDWVVITTSEQRALWSAYSDLLLRYHVEQNLRRELAEAFTRLNGCIGDARSHYALIDGRKVVAKSEALDREDTLLAKPDESVTL